MSLNCSIIAVGNEITSGEVLNRNASRLAELVQEMGFEVKVHLAVPDDRPLIMAALAFAEKYGDFIFTTGGLGPTTDDFTREVISEYTGLPLIFDTEMWGRLEILLQARGLRVRDEHRQQCFFPDGSRIIENSYGTAHGFICSRSNQMIFVLPGPPKEIESIWENGLAVELKKIAGGQPRTNLHAWCVVGQPESEVAAVVEGVFAGSGLQLGYRASLPYVYVKVWIPDAKASRFQPLLRQLESELSRWWLIPADEDPAEALLDILDPTVGWRISDPVTGGLLGARLGEALAKRKHPGSLHLETVIGAGGCQAKGSDPKSSDVKSSNLKIHHLWVEKDGDDWLVGLTRFGQVQKKPVKVPLRLQANDERARTYISEITLLYWLELLRAAT